MHKLKRTVELMARENFLGGSGLGYNKMSALDFLPQKILHLSSSNDSEMGPPGKMPIDDLQK